MAPSSTLPRVLNKIFAIGFQIHHDEETDTATGVDFEPYHTFEDPEETTSSLRLWTGNDEADGSPFRILGASGAGDFAGFWLAKPDVDITEQPVVMFSVGDGSGVIAKDMNDLINPIVQWMAFGHLASDAW